LHVSFTNAAQMKVSDVITPSRIEVRLSLQTKDELLEYLPEILARNGDVEDIAEVRRVIRHRESLMSTGIGHGIALPHGKSNSVRTTTAALVTLAEPMEYDSLDGEPIQLAVILVGKEDHVSTHLKLLSKISRVVASDWFKHEALAAETPEQIHELLVRADSL
jgi:mannitol/fructose-specific phosphotransferase system IIA component (Ntr-type)